MTGLQESATQRRIDAQCAGECHVTMAQAIALLKRANRYVGIHPSIGGQKLGEEITDFIAAWSRETK